MKDTDISDIFKISPFMLQRWKNSHDYRYLIYEFLSSRSKDMQLEPFMEELKEKEQLLFMDSVEFKKLLERRVDALPNGRDLMLVDPTDIFNNENVYKNKTIAKNKNNEVVVIESLNRFPDQKKLLSEIKKLKKALKNGLRLKGMSFITNNALPPRYVRDQDMFVDDIEIEFINFHDFTKRVTGKKVIFTS